MTINASFFPRVVVLGIILGEAGAGRVGTYGDVWAWAEARPVDDDTVRISRATDARAEERRGPDEVARMGDGDGRRGSVARRVDGLRDLSPAL